MSFFLDLTEYDEFIMVGGILLIIFGWYVTGAILAGLGLIIYLVEQEKISF